MTESWKPVVGFEHLYEVSDAGRVKRLARATEGREGVTMHFPETILDAAVTRLGYRRVRLSGNGKRATLFVHVLVLTAFVGPRPAGQEGCHGNGIRTDNRLVNLRWDTRSENQKDSVRHGSHASTSRTHCPEGHPYDEENTYITPRGSRNCRACGRTSSARFAQKEKAA